MSLFFKTVTKVSANAARCGVLVNRRLPTRCVFCERLLTSQPKAEADPHSKKETLRNDKDANEMKKQNVEMENIRKSVEEDSRVDIIEQDYKKVISIQDIPKHELPVKDIIGKTPTVWWDTEMNRPSIRERLWQQDPIIEQLQPMGLGKLRKPKLRTVKKAHIRTLDQQFVNAYETIGANKVAFESVVSEFRRTSVRGWGFLEFQYVAMEYMKAFNVDKDVDCYNQLLNMYPRGPLRIANYFSEAMHHGILEQHAAVKVIKRMASKEAYPNTDTLDIMLDVFGPRCGPVDLMRQLWYWVPKLRNLNPWLVPDPLPSNPLDTAKILLERMGDYDQVFDLMCGSYETADVDPAYLMSSMNEEQREELAALPKGSNITVTGPFFQYITRRMSQQYFVLRGDPPMYEVKPRTDEIEFHPEDYEEGYVYAIAITGQPDQYMARLWIKELAKKNSNIENLFVTFNLTGGTELLDVCHES